MIDLDKDQEINHKIDQEEEQYKRYKKIGILNNNILKQQFHKSSNTQIDIALI